FRIAFDDDGDDDFVDPVSINPINPNRAKDFGPSQDGRCLDRPDDHCGESDFCSFVSDTGGPTVLWDELDPHLPGSQVPDRWSWTVTLPDVECERCTLQVMQVMEDIVLLTWPGHGPFDGDNDLYYRC